MAENLTLQTLWFAQIPLSYDDLNVLKSHSSAMLIYQGPL
jgi:hypothetical protein